MTIVGVYYSGTLTKQRGFWRGVFDIFRRTDRRYFGYQVFRNLVFSLKERLPIGHRSRGTLGFFSIRRWAHDNGVPFAVVNQFNDPVFVAQVRESRPDIILTRVNQILRTDLLGVAPAGCWCLHSSALPSYQGIAAEFHAIVDGTAMLGFSIMQMTSQLDRGPIIVQKTIDLPEHATLHEAIERNIANGQQAIRLGINALMNGKVTSRPQQGEGSYRSWPNRHDGVAFRSAGRRYVLWGEAWRYLTR